MVNKSGPVRTCGGGCVNGVLKTKWGTVQCPVCLGKSAKVEELKAQQEHVENGRRTVNGQEVQ